MGGSLLGLLLDDLPAAVLVSGQVPIRVGIEVTGEPPDVGGPGRDAAADGLHRSAPDGVMEQRRHGRDAVARPGPARR